MLEGSKTGDEDPTAKPVPPNILFRAAELLEMRYTESDSFCTVCTVWFSVL